MLLTVRKNKMKINYELVINAPEPDWPCVGEEATLTEDEVLAANTALKDIVEARKVIDLIFKAAKTRFNSPKPKRIIL